MIKKKFSGFDRFYQTANKMIPRETLEQTLDAIRNCDIYLIDLILKRSFDPEMKILDAGCGMGRNSEYFLQAGFEVFGADISKDDIDFLRQRAMRINPELTETHFRQEPLENMSFEAESMDFVICNAVLHFARDEAQFDTMLHGAWKTLKPGGIFFCRLASSIGIEKRVTHLEGRRYLLPDGSKRFLVDETMILQRTHKLGAHFLEPLKTVNVQNARCMTNWILKK
jgi:tellurite methyltransferase